MLRFLIGFIALFTVCNSQTCDDSSECGYQTFTATSGTVNCYGYYGCKYTKGNAYYLNAYGAYGAYYAELYTYTVRSYGHYGAYYAKLQTQLFYGYGYRSGYYADIKPRSSALTIYFYGYYAGQYSDVYCYNADTCKVYCGESYGCSSSKFYCYSGSTCYYLCSSSCPTLYSGISSEVYVNGKLIDQQGNINEQQLEKNSQIGLTDEQITLKIKENTEIKKEQIKIEQENGNMDEIDELKEVIETMKQNGEEITPQLLDSYNQIVYNHGNKYNYNDEYKKYIIIGTVIGIFITLISMLGLYIVNKWFLKSNKSGYQPLTSN